MDFSICSNFLFILTQSDASGEYNVKSRNIYETSWTTYPSLGTIDATCVACDGAEPVVITTTTTKSVYKYYNNSQSWRSIHDGATEISVENGRLFYLYPTTTNGNVWSRQVHGGTYKRWGETFVGNKIAGDANGLPWVAFDNDSDPLRKWDSNYHKWTFAFNSGPVYEMDIQSYVRMFILSDPQVSGGGYTLYSHELFSGGWTTFSLPVY